MLIYEVNLSINDEIFNEYDEWLISHVKVMLQFRGFLKAEIFQEKVADASFNKTNLIVHYSVKSEKDLENYFKLHALSMREEGVKRFGDKFSAFWRVLSPACVVCEGDLDASQKHAGMTLF